MRNKTLLLIFITVAAFAQDKEISAPGNYTFSTEFSFGKRAISTNGISDRVKKTYYNENGKVIKIEYYADGTADNIVNYTYENGLLIKQETDIDGDNTIDKILTFNYNANGFYVQITFDNNADGTPDIIKKYKYDANDNIIRYDYDEDADGVSNLTTISFYDSRENMIKYETDTDGDGVPNRRTVKSYDANNNCTKTEFDSDGDGTIDRIFSYEFSSSGKLLRAERDNNNDGNPDYIDTKEYNDNDDLIKTTVDINGDGSNIRITLMEYDSNSNVTLKKIDSNGDGVFTYIYAYEYNENNQLIQEKSDVVGNNIFTLRTIYSYDINLNQTGARTYIIEGNKFTSKDTMTYPNPIKCRDIGNGSAHRFTVDIPESGIWQFSMCGASFNNNMALSNEANCGSNLFSTTNGCPDGHSMKSAPLSKGKYYLTITGKEIDDKGEYTLYILREGNIADIEKHNSKISFDIYPNPATNAITISTDKVSIASVNVYGVDGKLVASQLGNQSTLNVASLAKGTYIVLLEDTDGKTYRRKFLKH